MSDKHDSHENGGHGKGGHDNGHAKSGGHGSGDRPKGEGNQNPNGIFEEAVRKLSAVLGPDLNTVLSLLNPYLGDTAEAAAKKAKEVIGEDHWLCTKKGESVIGVIASLLEKYADSQPRPLKAVLEKGSDWLESFAGALRKSDPHEDHTQSNPSASPATNSPKTQELDQEFLKWAQEAMAKCDPITAEAFRAEVLKMAATREELKKLIAEGLPKPKDDHHGESHHDPEPPKVRLRDEIGDWLDEQLPPVITNLEQRVAIARLENSRLARGRKAKKGWLSRLLSIPLTIVKAIFFPK